MKCPTCQTEVSPDAKFCRECGYDLRKKPLEALSKDYGKPHSYTPKHLTDRILTTRTSIEGERKLVTVLFADVANYTSIAEKLDPERVHQIMDGCFKLLMDEIHRYEGTINQFTGDGIMALFGAPLAHEDHAQRACLAANGIQDTLEGYGKGLEEKHRILFKMRVGLNSGPVVVGSIGDDLRMDYTAIGDTTNLAFRIQSQAEPGDVLISENTYKMVRESFEFSSQGKVSLKGKEEPVEIFKLQQKGDFHRPRLGYERQIYSEMVGRDDELAKLELQVMKAVTGEGSLINIIGEAGIGKSRLVAELKNQEVMNRVTLLEGDAISIGRNLSFHPIIALLKRWARIRESDKEADAFEKLRSAIHAISPQETDEVLPFVATLMSMKLAGKYAERVDGIEGEALEKLILKNIRLLLTKAVSLRPVVIVMEDLHWADASSIELLESLFRLVETHRIVFVNVFRPGHKETGDRIVETMTESWPTLYTEIVLGPLDERMGEALINNMLNVPDLPYGIRDQILQRAGGNPFFIEEVLRSLIDERAVVLKQGAFEVAEKIDEVIIPQTIHDVLMARIDRLETKTRNLVKFAAVIGRSFFYRILREVARTIEDIDRRLGYLKDIQMIRERRRLDELEYLFRHALAQEAAYGSILVEKRKQLHLQVADSIESVFTERLYEFYGMLAYHYSRGENEDKAEQYLIKAGEEALKSSASSEALYSYQEALKLYLRKHGDAADPAKLAMLEKNIALAFFNRGMAVEAEEYFSRALAFYWVKSPKHMLPVTLKFIHSVLHFLIGLYLPFLKWKKDPSSEDNETFEMMYKRGYCLLVMEPKRFFIESFYGLRELTRVDWTKVQVGLEILVTASAMFSWSGISYRTSRKILEFCEGKLPKDNVKLRIQYDLSSILHSYLTGDWDSAKEYDDHLVNQYLSAGGSVHSASIYIEWLTCLSIDCGRFKDAQRLVRKLAWIADVYDNDLAMIYKFRLNMKLLMKYRKTKEALDELEEGIPFVNKMGMKTYFCYCHTVKARIFLLSGDVAGAERSLLNAEENLDEIKDTPYFLNSYLLCRFVYYLHKLEESIETESRSEQAKNQKVIKKIGRRLVRNSEKIASDRTEAYRLMGVSCWHIGRHKKALAWWKRSIDAGERFGARLELSRSYMQVGKSLLNLGSKYREMNGIHAEEYLRKAETMFREMDLQWDLDELKRGCQLG